jgi:2'-5' RNA ligase
MKICFALLLNAEIHNYARKLAYRLDREFGTGLIAAFLPQHVTLSPAFAVTDLDEAERCFDRLAAGWSSLDIHLTGLALKVSPCRDSAVIWMEVADNEQLDAMHREIRAEGRALTFLTRFGLWGGDRFWHRGDSRRKSICKPDWNDIIILK